MSISFNNEEKSQRVLFSIYADFECALVPNNMQGCDSDMSDSDEELLNNTHSQKNTEPNMHTHVPHSYCYLIKDSEDDSSVIRQYRGVDAARHFVNSIRDDVVRIGDILYLNRQMDPDLTPDDATTCHTCGKGFSDADVKGREGSYAF